MSEHHYPGGAMAVDCLQVGLCYRLFVCLFVCLLVCLFGLVRLICLWGAGAIDCFRSEYLERRVEEG